MLQKKGSLRRAAAGDQPVACDVLTDLRRRERAVDRPVEHVDHVRGRASLGGRRSPETILAARRSAVAAAPMAMIQRAIASTWPGALQNGAMSAATVITAMRCCLAMGPEKSASSPHAQPSSRV